MKIRDSSDLDTLDDDWTPQPARKLSRRDKQKQIRQTPEEHFGESGLRLLQSVMVPEDLGEIVRAPSQPLEIDRHVIENVVPGGRHPEVRWHVEHLEEVLSHWRLWAPSPQEKWKKTLTRWEVYTAVAPDSWICTILGTEGDHGDHNVITVYSMSRQTVSNRYIGDERTGKEGYLHVRGKE